MIDVNVYAQLTPTLYAQVREVLFTIYEAPPTLPGSARHSSLTKRSQDRKAPISMIDVDVYAQLTPTLYAQVRVVLFSL